MITLKEYRRQMIVAHPTFCCGISGEILDVDRSHIISFLHPKTKTKKIDVVSINGFNSLSRDLRLKFNFKIIENVDEL